MKKLVWLAVWLMAWAHPAAAYFQIDGTAVWSVRKPDCSIEVVGAIQNIAPANTSSGLLRLVLWATVGAFPSAGKVIAEADVGYLQGGAQRVDFRDRVRADLGTLTGDYQFTVVLMESTLGGWVNRVAMPAGSRTLLEGDFVDGVTWAVPSRGYTRPRAVRSGQKLRLKTKANSNFERISAGTEADCFVSFTSAMDAELKRGSSFGSVSYTYARRRDSLKGKRWKTGRVSLFSGSVREAEIVLYHRSASRGVFRMTGGGRVIWGTFLLR